MSLSFPESSPEKMRHRYALFKDPGSKPEFPIRRRRIEFNQLFEREVPPARALSQGAGTSCCGPHQFGRPCASLRVPFWVWADGPACATIRSSSPARVEMRAWNLRVPGCFAVALFALGAAAAQPTGQHLLPGAAIERPLAGGESHSYG